MRAKSHCCHDYINYTALFTIVIILMMSVMFIQQKNSKFHIKFSYGATKIFASSFLVWENPTKIALCLLWKLSHHKRFFAVANFDRDYIIGFRIIFITYIIVVVTEKFSTQTFAPLQNSYIVISLFHLMDILDLFSLHKLKLIIEKYDENNVNSPYKVKDIF